MILIFKQGDNIKHIDENSNLIPILLSTGWECTNKILSYGNDLNRTLSEVEAVKDALKTENTVKKIKKKSEEGKAEETAELIG